MSDVTALLNKRLCGTTLWRGRILPHPLCQRAPIPTLAALASRIVWYRTMSRFVAPIYHGISDVSCAQGNRDALCGGTRLPTGTGSGAEARKRTIAWTCPGDDGPRVRGRQHHQSVQGEI